MFLLAASSGCGGVTEEPFEGVEGTAIDTFDVPPSKTQAPRPKTRWSAIGARVMKGGKETVFAGTLDDEGRVEIPRVPEGTYWLSLSSPATDFPGEQDSLLLVENTARTLDLGVTRSHRDGLVPMTKPSFISLDVELAVPFRVFTDDGMGGIQPLDDTLELFSRSTGVAGFFAAEAKGSQNAPGDGATQISGWKVDAFTAFAFSDTAISLYTPKDDLTFLHAAATQVDEASLSANSPWRRFQARGVVEALAAAPVTLTNGGTAKVQGTFTKTMPRTFSFDYDGDAFAQALADAPVPATSTVLSFSVVMEPGAPAPEQGSTATLLDFTVFGTPDYGSAACDPNSCDPSACPTTCGIAVKDLLPGTYKRDFTYGNPFESGQELAQLDLSFSRDVSELVAEGTYDRLPGRISVSAPAGELSGKTLSPVIGLPRNVTVNGKPAPVDQITAGVGPTPVIAFEPPKLGKADVYQVRAVQLDNIVDGKDVVAGSRSVLFMYTKGTSVTIPRDVLKTGRRYTFLVTALASPGYDPAKPNYAHGARIASAQTFSGVVTP